MAIRPKYTYLKKELSLILWLRYLPRNMAGNTAGKETKKYIKTSEVINPFAKYPVAPIKLAGKK